MSRMPPYVDVSRLRLHSILNGNGVLCTLFLQPCAERSPHIDYRSPLSAPGSVVSLLDNNAVRSVGLDPFGVDGCMESLYHETFEVVVSGSPEQVAAEVARLYRFAALNHFDFCGTKEDVPTAECITVQLPIGSWQANYMRRLLHQTGWQCRQVVGRRVSSGTERTLIQVPGVRITSTMRVLAAYGIPAMLVSQDAMARHDAYYAGVTRRMTPLVERLSGEEIDHMNKVVGQPVAA